MSFPYLLACVSLGRVHKIALSTTLDHNQEALSSFPKGEYFAMGYNGALSSVAWVGSIYSYADALLNGVPARNLPYRVQMASNLDSNWLYPYEFAGVVFDGSYEESRIARLMLERSLRIFPNEWRLRVYLAMQMQKQGTAVDSIAHVLESLPLFGNERPEYLNTLMFTMLAKGGKSADAMSRLSSVYQTLRDPFVRVQFQRKIGDLLWRNEVYLGTDSSAFVGGIGSMLDADPVQAGAAKTLLIRLVQPETKDVALLEARHLARQFRSFQAAQLGTPQ